MSRKFSLAYMAIPGATPLEQIEIAAHCGYDYVSLRTIPMGLPGEPESSLCSPQLFADIQKALRETGLMLNDIELARVREDLDISAYEPEFERAAALGARDVIASVWSGDKAFYIQQYTAVCDMAAKYGLNVNLEFVPFSGVRNLWDALELLESVNRSNTTILVDLLHAHRCGITSDNLANVVPEKLGFFHICDGPAYIPAINDPEMVGVAREGRNYLGQGGIDVAGMLKAMPANICSIELPNKTETDIRGRWGHASQCLETTKAYFKANGIE